MNNQRAVLATLVLAIICSPCLGGDIPDLYVCPGNDTQGLLRMDLADPFHPVQIVPENLINTSTGITVDHLNRKVYWIANTQSTPSQIRWADLDGQNWGEMVTPQYQPEDVEVDSATNTLYWSARFSNAIFATNMSTRETRQIVSTLDPRGLDIDLVNGRIYWTSYAYHSIFSTALDGTDYKLVLGSGIEKPFDVTVDPINNRLYWVELGPTSLQGRVWMANLDGSSATLIASQQRQPTDLLIDYANGHIYWGSDVGLFRADLDGANVVRCNAPEMSYRNLAFDVTRVPEPATLGLLVASLCGLIIRRRR